MRLTRSQVQSVRQVFHIGGPGVCQSSTNTFGLIVMFYSNEHEPVHVHGKFQGREMRDEIIVIDGVVKEIIYSTVTGRAPLESNELRFFEEIVAAKALDIVTKWIDFFVLHKSITAERITRRLK